MSARSVVVILCLVPVCIAVPAVATAQWSEPGIMWDDGWDDPRALDIDDSGTRLVTLIPASGADENSRSIEVTEKVAGVWQTPVVLAQNGHYSDDIFQFMPQITTPILSGDGETIAFLGYTGSDYAVYVSDRQDGSWNPPTALPTGLDSHHYWLSLSRDGDTLALSNYPFMGDLHLYVMHRDAQVWGAPVQVDSNNMGGQYPSLSADGTRLVWVSDAKLVYAEAEEGVWGAPQFLTDNLWSEFQVRYPQLAADGASLFYWYVTLEDNGSSYTEVAQDLYVMRRQSGVWLDPEKVNGDPVTPAMDIVVAATADEHATRLVYTRSVIHDDVIDSSNIEVSEWQGGTDWLVTPLVVQNGYGNLNRFPKLTPDGRTLFFDGRSRYSPWVDSALWTMDTSAAPPPYPFFEDDFESGTLSAWSAAAP